MKYTITRLSISELNKIADESFTDDEKRTIFAIVGIVIDSEKKSERDAIEIVLQDFVFSKFGKSWKDYIKQFDFSDNIGNAILTTL